MKWLYTFLLLSLLISLKSQDSLHLLYKQAATEWMEALPIGNGSLGAMIYGGVEEELLKLNHDEFWSGEPKDISNPKAQVYRDSVAALVRQKKYTEADQLIRKMQGPFSQAYMPLADLHIKFQHQSPSNYSRKLDISEAISELSYSNDGVTYTRRYFASHPDSLIVAQFFCSAPALLSFDVTLSSRVKHRFIEDANKLVLQVKAPKHAEPNYRSQFSDEEAIQYDDWGGKGINAFVYVIVEQSGGSISIKNDTLSVANADKAILKVIAATSFNGPFKSPSAEGKDPKAICDKIAAKVAGKNTLILEATHRRDYQSLFNRLSLVIGSSTKDPRNTDDRLRDFKTTEDPSLVALLFQYGRYLLICSSRPGSQAANLQGIWSKSTRPPWSSNYTQNINAEMNYWPAEVCNLGELTEPLIRHIGNNSKTGKRVARANYGLQGWVSHHNGDIWAHSAPVGDYGEGNPVWANWALGGAWMCQHIWEHYLYTGDLDFLEENYHILKGATLFVMGLLDENDERYLETMFGTSPENQFYDPETGQAVSVTRGPAMDLAITNELLNNTLKAAALLEIEEQFQKLLIYKIEKLQPFRISKSGILMEWNEDFTEVDSLHRHLSHLYGLHPGNQVNAWDTPNTFVASRNSLLKRGDQATGWSMGWKTNLWARMLDGEHAYAIIKNLFNPVSGNGIKMGGGGLYNNLLDAHPPFQIDGNFGVTAGIAEMFVQSHTGAIHILPALPDLWKDGQVKGLRTRGGGSIDIKWKDGQPSEVNFSSDLGGTFRLRSEWPLELSNNSNANSNPLLDTTPIPEPIIYGNPDLSLELKKYYDYDFKLEAGESITIKPL